MRNFIKQANLNVLNGTLAGTMQFSPGLNLIGGENGTLSEKKRRKEKGSGVVLGRQLLPIQTDEHGFAVVRSMEHNVR